MAINEGNVGWVPTGQGTREWWSSHEPLVIHEGSGPQEYVPDTEFHRNAILFVSILRLLDAVSPGQRSKEKSGPA